MPGKHAAIALAVVIGQIARVAGFLQITQPSPVTTSCCDGSYTPVIDLAEGFNLFQESGLATRRTHG